MGGHELNKVSLLYENISLYAKESPYKPALIGPDGQKTGYIDFITVYNDITQFIKNNNIIQEHRIAILMNDAMNMGLSVIPVMANSIIVLIDNDMSMEQFDYYFKLLHVDYIITDNLTSAGCMAAEKIGVGIILNLITGTMNEKGSKLELKSERIISYPEAVEGNADLLSVTTTSGTTSTPKIVPTTCKQYFAALNARIKIFEFTSNDITLIVTKLYKTTSLNAMLTILSVGGTIHLKC